MFHTCMKKTVLTIDTRVRVDRKELGSPVAGAFCAHCGWSVGRNFGLNFRVMKGEFNVCLLWKTILVTTDHDWGVGE